MVGWILFLGGIGLVALSAFKASSPIICLPVALIWWIWLLQSQHKNRNLRIQNNPTKPTTPIK
jgi:hypothetical protein